MPSLLYLKVNLYYRFFLFVCFILILHLHDMKKQNDLMEQLWRVENIYYMTAGVCVSVCLSLSKIAFKVLNRFEYNFQEMLLLDQGWCSGF